MINKYFLLLVITSLLITICYSTYYFLTSFNHLAYAHIYPGTPNSVFIEKDGYQMGFLPYPKNPKVNDNSTLLNFNVQKDGNDVANTFASLIIMDKDTRKIVHQIPYQFYLFADMSYLYVFKNEGKYSLSLLTKIAGDEKYKDMPLIVTFDLDTEGVVINNGSNINSIIIYSVIALAILVGLIFIYFIYFKKRLKIIKNKKSKT